MLKIKYTKLMLSLTALLCAVQLHSEAAPALEIPGIKIDIGEKEKLVDIKRQDEDLSEYNMDEIFTIGRIKLTSKDIQLKDYSKILAKYENRNVSLGELNELAHILLDDLRNCGYPAAWIYSPKKTISKGEDITVVILPGRYGKVTIENDSDLSTEIAQGYLVGLKQGKIIKRLELETAVNKFSTVGGINSEAVLSAGEKSGLVDLKVILKKGKASKELLYANNYGSKDTGRYNYALQGNVQFPKIAGKVDYVLLLSNGGKHRYNLGYTQNIGRSATKLGVSVVHSDYTMGGRYSALGIRGNAYIFKLKGSTPIFNSWSNSLNVNYGFNYRELRDEKYNFEKEKHSSSVYAGISGTVRRGKSELNYDISDTFGRLKFDNDIADFVYKASDTEGIYNKANLYVDYCYTFDRYFDVQLYFDGQLAGKNLDGSEQIVLGGRYGVRAYPNDFGAGDEGYVFNAEFRYRTKVPGLTVFTFFDMGHVKITNDGREAFFGGETVKGWGIGVSYIKPGNFFICLDYARRIGSPKYYTDDIQAKAKSRFWFMLGKIF